jgi:hypothetical protein
MENTTKQKIFKLFKKTFDYLLERGYEVKFKNISKIIEEIDEVVKKSLEIDKRYIITAKIKMFIDPMHTFTGDYIFSTYNDYAEVDYFKMEKNEHDFEIENQKNLVGTGNVSFELSLEYIPKEKVFLPIVQSLKKSVKFIENFDVSYNDMLRFEIPIKFKVIRYLI